MSITREARQTWQRSVGTRAEGSRVVGLSCRQITLPADVIAFADMVRQHADYFTTHDLLSLPRTRARAASWVTQGARLLYGAFDQGECLGFCGIDPRSSLGHVFYGVAPQRSGQGVGREVLLHAVDSYFAQIGAKVDLNLLVSDDNLGSQAVARAAGFRVNPFAKNLQMRFGIHPELRGFTEMTLDMERMVCIRRGQGETLDAAGTAASSEYAQLCARVSATMESACV